MTEPVAEKPRECGPCIACCVSPDIDVPELFKKAWKRCPHLSREGPPCSIYGTRPGVCRSFSCAWLDGILPEELRPDRCGFYLVVKESPERVFFALVEVAQNAWKGDGSILNVVAAQIKGLRDAGEKREIDMKIAMHPSSYLRKEIDEWLRGPASEAPPKIIYEGEQP